MFECVSTEPSLASSMNCETASGFSARCGLRRLMTTRRSNPSAPLSTAVKTSAMPAFADPLDQPVAAELLAALGCERGRGCDRERAAGAGSRWDAPATPTTATRGCWRPMNDGELPAAGARLERRSRRLFARRRDRRRRPWRSSTGGEQQRRAQARPGRHNPARRRQRRRPRRPVRQPTTHSLVGDGNGGGRPVGVGGRERSLAPRARRACWRRRPARRRPSTSGHGVRRRTRARRRVPPAAFPATPDRTDGRSGGEGDADARQSIAADGQQVNLAARLRAPAPRFPPCPGRGARRRRRPPRRDSCVTTTSSSTRMAAAWLR